MINIVAKMPVKADQVEPFKTIDFHNAAEHFTPLLPKPAELCDGEIGIDLFDLVF